MLISYETNVKTRAPTSVSRSSSGGWTLDAAAAVCAAPGEGEPDPIETLDALGRLVQRSMVVVDRGEHTRHHLLETIRQYALGRLVESGEADDTRARHLAWCLDLARGAEAGLAGPELLGWLQRLDAEADNIRAAIEWGLDADPEATARLCVANWLHWRLRSAGLEGWTTLHRAVVRLRGVAPPEDPAAARERMVLEARLAAEAAFAGATWGGVDTTALAEEAVSMARSVGDDATLVHATAALWTARFFRGDHDGLRELSEEQLRRAAAIDDAFSLALARAAMANFLWRTDLGEAERQLRAATEDARRSGNPFAVAFTSLSRARVLGATGRIDEARALFDEAAAAYERLGDTRFALVARSDLAHALRRAGLHEEALGLLRETIGSWLHQGNRGAIANQLEAFAFIAIEEGDCERAARLLGTAEALRDAADARMLGYERAEYDAAVSRLRESLAARDLDLEWTAGRTMDGGAAVSLAVGI
jgi:tetratricopeptide (TPR) repeat protein